MKLLPAIVWAVALQLGAPARAETAPGSDDDLINADRPGIADGSNVIGAGRVQVEAGVQQENRRGAGSTARTRFVPTLLRIGIDKNLELRVEGNTYTWTKTSDAALGATRNEGIAPTSIGLKAHFADADGSQQPSLGAIVRFFPRTGTGGLRPAHASADVRLAADWDIAPKWSLNPNIGLGLYEDDEQRLYRSILVAATLSYNVSRALSIFVDAAVQSPERKHGRSAAVIDVGAAYLVGADLQLDLSAGAKVTGTTPPRRFWSLGISRRY